MSAMAMVGMSLAFGCAADEAAATSDTSTAAATFAEGNFQLTTHVVSDKCVDGGLDLVFMPNGVDKPYDLTNLTQLPASSGLPKTYDIELQAPFQKLNVTVAADGANMKIEDAAQTGIKVDEAQWPNCVADMTVDAAITVIDNDNVTVNAKVTVNNWTGSDCPTADNGCVVTLDMKGVRKN